MQSPDALKSEIAAAAARLIVEDGLEYGPAKRRALRLLDLPARTALPDNEGVEAAVREHISLFCGDSQPAELAALRGVAVQWMQRLASFRPYLSGAVWRGTATRNSDIWLQLFCDDSKSAEIALIDQGIDYRVQSVHGLQGEPVDALSFQVPCQALAQSVGLNLVIYDHDDLRGALRAGSDGRPPRGDLAAVQMLLQGTEAACP